MVRWLIEPPVQLSAVGAPYWFDKPTIIVGAGPSLKGFDLERLRGLGRVIAVNGAMHYLPWADAFLTIDFDFINHNESFLSQPGPPLYIAVPHDACVGHPYAPKIKRATYLWRQMKSGYLSENCNVLECGGTSGYTALNFAYLKLTKFIALFGFDYKDNTHFCPERYLWAHGKSDWRTWRQMFDCAATQLTHIRVINANPESMVNAFPKVTHDAAIEEMREWKNDSAG